MLAEIILNTDRDAMASLGFQDPLQQASEPANSSVQRCDDTVGLGLAGEAPVSFQKNTRGADLHEPAGRRAGGPPSLPR